MEGVLSSPFTSLRYDAASFSLLVDNVQFHLEGGLRSNRFLSLHALADAVDSSKAVALNAGKLCDEIGAAWSQLERLPFARLAISQKTRSLFEPGALPLKQRDPRLYLALEGPVPSLDSTGNSFADVFQPLITELVRVAGEAPRKSRLLASTAGRRPSPESDPGSST